MSKQHNKYVVAGVDLSDVRNRNEVRVAEALRLVLEEYGNPELDVQTV